jgi:type II secretory pathway pseudopilin PulG
MEEMAKKMEMLEKQLKEAEEMKLQQQQQRNQQRNQQQNQRRQQQQQQQYKTPDHRHQKYSPPSLPPTSNSSNSRYDPDPKGIFYDEHLDPDYLENDNAKNAATKRGIDHWEDHGNDHIAPRDSFKTECHIMNMKMVTRSPSPTYHTTWNWLERKY